MTPALSQRQCQPCLENVPALKGDDVQRLKEQLPAEWRIVKDQRLEKQFKFKDFKEALAFVNLVGEIAEHENHHPDVYLAYGEVRIELWTHKIKGLSENDFILAAKINSIHQK